MKINLLGIDLAKNVFQLCALNQANKVLFNRSIRRARFRSSIARLEPTTIAMEACSSAHYWGRAFEGMGHQVVLVPAQHVTPFVRGGKSDARDALAICEAAQRPGLHPVPIKSIEQQDIQLLHRLRQRQVQHSTALANQMRSLGREYGVIFPEGIHSLIARLPEVLEDGKIQLKGMTKNGDRYLRTLMIHGARSVITRGLKNRPELAQWVQPIIDRRGFNKAVVALANKLARISWVIVTTGEPFDMQQAFKPAV